MCQDIQQVTFFCGHQTKFWWGTSRFCLFAGDNASRFHTTYLSFTRDNENCPRCLIGERIKQQQKVLKRAEFRQMVQNNYAKTRDGFEEEQAKKFETLSQQARSTLTAARVAELELQIKESVAYHLGKDNLAPNSKVVLLRTLTRLPDVFNIQELVRLFASRYFRTDDKKRTLSNWERKTLFGIAQQAGLNRTFKAGLKMQPLPAPTRKENTDSELAMDSAKEKVTEGLAKMVLSPEAKVA